MRDGMQTTDDFNTCLTYTALQRPRCSSFAADVIRLVTYGEQAQARLQTNNSQVPHDYPAIHTTCADLRHMTSTLFVSPQSADAVLMCRLQLRIIYTST